MDWRERFIEQSKLTVNEFIKVLKADIDFDEIEDETKGKTALSTKKDAFIEAKNVIANLIELNYGEQDWARAAVNELIEAGEESVNGLIDSLSNKICVGDTIAEDVNDLKNAIKSRGIAFKDSLELIDALTELKRIATQEEIVIRSNEYAAGYAEMYADIYSEMDDKSGYRKEIDAVVIDPEGTVGEIITVMGLRIALPKEPSRTSILYFRKKKENQYFIRQAPPKSLKRKSARYHEKFIHEEYMRKRNGMWFMNNGKAEYITGAHWFLMSRFRTGCAGGYYYFTKAQQKVHWFLEACWCDERCFGMILEKIRRFGATDQAISFGLCKNITLRNGRFGMTSKTDKDANLNFQRLVHGFANLPFYFKPICLDEKSKSKLEFAEPAIRLSKKTKDADRVDNSLNTMMDFMSTKEDSYDGTALTTYVADELSKWKKQNGNTINHWEMVRKALTKGKRITGMAFILSTFENVTGAHALDNPEDALAGDRYKWLFLNSDPAKRDANGRTRTGLYRLFISCYEHYEGLIDKYGYPITDNPPEPTELIDGGFTKIGIRNYIANEAKAYEGNPRALYDFYRRTPINMEDGWRVAEGTCMFNQMNILEQIKYNENLPTSKANGDIPSILRRGNFFWENGIRDGGRVIFKDDPAGRFYIAWMPSEDLQNNNYWRNGVLNPGNTSIGAFGIDPYKVSKTADGQAGSKGSMHGYTKANNQTHSHFFFLEYIARPETKDIFEEDMIKAMVFYAMPALIESNINSLLEKMYRRGYRRFSLLRPDKPKHEVQGDDLKYGGIPSNSENTIQMHSSCIEYHVERYVGPMGEESEDGENGMGRMYFNRTLYDWLIFDVKNRTRRDASISSGYAIMACTAYNARPVNVDQNKKIVKAFVRQYDNKGTVGTYKKEISYGNR